MYDKQIRSQVESEANIGRLVSIDIHTGDYEVGDRLLETVERLQCRRPDAEVWTERIGYNAVRAVGGSLQRKQVLGAST